MLKGTTYDSVQALDVVSLPRTTVERNKALCDAFRIMRIEFAGITSVGELGE